MLLLSSADFLNAPIQGSLKIPTIPKPGARQKRLGDERKRAAEAEERWLAGSPVGDRSFASQAAAVHRMS